MACKRREEHSFTWSAIRGGLMARNHARCEALFAGLDWRRVRAIRYLMRVAKLPHHKDFATFDYGAAAVTRTQVEPFCSGQFTDEAHNLILVGGTGTGKTHIAIALGTTLINNGKKARFFNAVDLINALIKEQAEGNAGKIIRQLSALDLVIIRRVGLHPVPQIRRRAVRRPISG